MSGKLTLTDILIEQRKREEKYFKDYLYYSELIKKEAERVLGKVKVLVFGSILRKDEVPQDIDVLIVSPRFKKTSQKSKVQTAIWKKVGFLSPFEFHFVTPEDYKSWYRYFIKEKIEV